MSRNLDARDRPQMQLDQDDREDTEIAEKLIIPQTQLIPDGREAATMAEKSCAPCEAPFLTGVERKIIFLLAAQVNQITEDGSMGRCDGAIDGWIPIIPISLTCADSRPDMVIFYHEGFNRIVFAFKHVEGTGWFKSYGREFLHYLVAPNEYEPPIIAEFIELVGSYIDDIQHLSKDEMSLSKCTRVTHRCGKVMQSLGNMMHFDDSYDERADESIGDKLKSSRYYKSWACTVINTLGYGIAWAGKKMLLTDLYVHLPERVVDSIRDHATNGREVEYIATGINFGGLIAQHVALNTQRDVKMRADVIDSPGVSKKTYYYTTSPRIHYYVCFPTHVNTIGTYISQNIVWIKPCRVSNSSPWVSELWRSAGDILQTVEDDQVLEKFDAMINAGSAFYPAIQVLSGIMRVAKRVFRGMNGPDIVKSILFTVNVHNHLDIINQVINKNNAKVINLDGWFSYTHFRNFLLSLPEAALFADMPKLLRETAKRMQANKKLAAVGDVICLNFFEETAVCLELTPASRVAIHDRDGCDMQIMSNIPDGLTHYKVIGDGHCLYRAVTYYLGHGEDVSFLRNIVAANLEANLEEYREFIDLPEGHTLENYIEAIRNGNEWAGDLEITLLARLLNRPIVVIGPDGQIRNRDIAIIDQDQGGEPIFVYYNDHNHYDALVVRESYEANDIYRHILENNSDEEHVPTLSVSHTHRDRSVRLIEDVTKERTSLAASRETLFAVREEHSAAGGDVANESDEGKEGGELEAKAVSAVPGSALGMSYVD